VPVEDDGEIPRRYSLKNAFRPTHSVLSAQDYASINQSLFPGCDYAPFRPNAFFPSILLFLYFTPDIRHAIESHQYELFNGGENHNLLQKSKSILTVILSSYLPTFSSYKLPISTVSIINYRAWIFISSN